MVLSVTAKGMLGIETDALHHYLRVTGITRRMGLVGRPSCALGNGRMICDAPQQRRTLD